MVLFRHDSSKTGDCMTVSRQLQSFWIDMNFNYITVYLVSETHGMCVQSNTRGREKQQKREIWLPKRMD